jgi:hypothetical protein
MPRRQAAAPNDLPVDMANEAVAPMEGSVAAAASSRAASRMVASADAGASKLADARATTAVAVATEATSAVVEVAINLARRAVTVTTIGETHGATRETTSPATSAITRIAIDQSATSWK